MTSSNQKYKSASDIREVYERFINNNYSLDKILNVMEGLARAQSRHLVLNKDCLVLEETLDTLRELGFAVIMGKHTTTIAF